MNGYPENWAGKSVGAIVREAREVRGVSLDEAARVTRIGKNYLAALEDDQFDKLPSPAYIKGFLRIYGDYLGLSADLLVSWYEQTAAPRQPPAEEPHPLPVPQEKGPQRPRGRWYITLLLLGLVVAVSLFFGERKETPPPVQAPVSPAVPIQPPRTTAMAVQPPRTSAMAAPAVPPPSAVPTEKTPEPAPSPTKGVVLKVKVNQDTRLTITIDSSLSQQYDLKAGDLIEWKGDRVFALDLSNAGGVEAELNGKPLAAFGPKGEPAHVVLKAEESKSGNKL